MFDQIIGYTWLAGCGFASGIIFTLLVTKVYKFFVFRDVPKEIQRTLIEVRKKVPLDPVKRKSLQPGDRPIPKGFRETLPFEKAPDRAAYPRGDKVVKKKPVPFLKNDFTEKQKKAIDEGGFYHKFYGSQLVVGKTPVVQNLPTQLHALEITKGGQLFVDNIPYEVNPSDIHRIKEELIKMRE
jgi:hypothetical protein